jgi:hypothetical protein
VIADLPEEAWETITWREGSKGPMCRQFTALRMHWGKGNQTRSARRPPDGDERGGLADRRAIAGNSGYGQRDEVLLLGPPGSGVAERNGDGRALAVAYPGQFYQDGKQLCGLDDFQGRRWDDLHRHVALAMLSYSFLALTRWQARSEATLPTLPEVHRQVLLALLTDLVQRWAQAEQPMLARPFAHLLERAPPEKIRSLTK